MQLITGLLEWNWEEGGEGEMGRGAKFGPRNFEKFANCFVEISIFRSCVRFIFIYCTFCFCFLLSLTEKCKKDFDFKKNKYFVGH